MLAAIEVNWGGIGTLAAGGFLVMAVLFAIVGYGPGIVSFVTSRLGSRVTNTLPDSDIDEAAKDLARQVKRCRGLRSQAGIDLAIETFAEQAKLRDVTVPVPNPVPIEEPKA
jgi:hypothetical protein